MPVAALKASNTTDLMKKEEGNDSLDTFIRQAIGKEPFLSFSRGGDSPVQWIQLLNALDQQDTPGWPLLTPLKVQMRKCDKCSREFYSSINYRRHKRVHHRLKKLGKDSAKNRDLLGIFWDKLSKDEAKELLSFDDVSVEEVPGSSIIKSLMELVHRPGFSSLPQYCLKAGSALLDTIQSKASRFPVSSEELFSILDDASENTFLCGAAVSMQKYIFDGEVAKIGVETKNLIACTSFLLEQKLVKAWLADKDAEALRCQKLLVEEEEAAQRRQAELLERKRLKKLRQKEQKAKELRQETDLEERTNDPLEAVPLADLSCPLTTSDSDHRSSTLEPLQLPSTDEDVDFEIQTGSGSGYSDSGTNNNAERQMVQRNNHRKTVSQWHLSPKSQWNHRNNGRRDFKSISGMNGARKWSQKATTDANGNILRTRPEQQTISQPDENKKHELLIGSISVILAADNCLSEHPMQKKTYLQDKHNRPDSAHYSTNGLTTKRWRLVSRNGIKETAMADQIPSNENGSSPSSVDHDYNGTENKFSGLQNSVLRGTRFSSQAAKAFLAERWKDAIASEHVKLVLSPEDKSSECDRVVLSESSMAGIGTEKFRSKTTKGVKLKYIPKQKTAT